MVFLTQRIFFVTAMTQLSHTLTPSFSFSIHFAHLHQRCLQLAQSVVTLQTLGNEVPMLYTLLILLAQNYFNSRRKASVRMQPAHKHILTSSHYQNTIISCPCTECKNVALGGVDTSFFSLFSTKKCAFLLFFGYFCTFLTYIAYFCGAATVGSALRALFDCFLVVFMLKYQGGHGV